MVTPKSPGNKCVYINTTCCYYCCYSSSLFLACGGNFLGNCCYASGTITMAIAHIEWVVFWASWCCQTYREGSRNNNDSFERLSMHWSPALCSFSLLLTLTGSKIVPCATFSQWQKKKIQWKKGQASKGAIPKALLVEKQLEKWLLTSSCRSAEPLKTRSTLMLNFVKTWSANALKFLVLFIPENPAVSVCACICELHLGPELSPGLNKYLARTWEMQSEMFDVYCHSAPLVSST